MRISSFERVKNSVLLTIPGINVIFAAYILASIQNIHDFSEPCKLVAYAGLDSIVRQSGNFSVSHTRMSKRGNHLLRYALIWTAYNVSRHNQTFSDYYQKKRDENKSHYNALGHCASKLIRSIHFMLSNNVEFNLE